MKKLFLTVLLTAFPFSLLFSHTKSLPACFNICKKRIYLECVNHHGSKHRRFCQGEYNECLSGCRKGIVPDKGYIQKSDEETEALVDELEEELGDFEEFFE